MPQMHSAKEDAGVREFFDFLDRREKISDWCLAIYLIAILLSLVFGGIALLIW